MAETTEYRYLGSHAHEFEIGEKRVQVGYGDYIKLSADDLKVEANAMVKDDLMEITDKAKGKEGKA